MEPHDETNRLAEDADLGPLPIAVMPEEVGTGNSNGSREETDVNEGPTADRQAPSDAPPSVNETRQSTVQCAEQGPLQGREDVEEETEQRGHQTTEVSDGTSPSVDKQPPEEDETSSLASTDQQHQHQQQGPEEEEESTVFSGLTYLGSSTVDAPMSPAEANNKMMTFKEQHAQPIPVNLSVPQTNAGKMVMLDPLNNTPLAVFYIKTVLLCVRGQDMVVSDCMCINVRHRKSQSFHCHVFLVNSEELVRKMGAVWSVC